MTNILTPRLPPTREELEQMSELFQATAASKDSRAAMAVLVQHSYFAEQALARCNASALDAAITSGDMVAVRSIHSELSELVAKTDRVLGAAIRLACLTAGNRSRMVAKKAARQRLDNDSSGKNLAKIRARELWGDWQNGKALHKSGAAFHRYVCKQLPSIISTKTVERWCKEWRSSE